MHFDFVFARTGVSPTLRSSEIMGNVRQQEMNATKNGNIGLLYVYLSQISVLVDMHSSLVI